MMMFVKSTMTGQVYKMDFLPKFGGWEAVTEADYLEYCKSMGLNP